LRPKVKRPAAEEQPIHVNEGDVQCQLITTLEIIELHTKNDCGYAK
jgi:hypothetical protein